MANISAFSINNCFANVADNNVHENIVSAENLTEEEVAAALAMSIALNAGAAYTYSLRALEAYNAQKGE